MSIGKRMLVATAVLLAGLATAVAWKKEAFTTHLESRTAARIPDQAAPRPAAPEALRDPPGGAVADSATDAGPLAIQVEVVDMERKPIPGADVGVVVSYSRGLDDSESIFHEARADASGRTRFEIARERPGARYLDATVWAHRRGYAVCVSGVLRRDRVSASVVRVTLAQRVRWTFTVLGADGRPVPRLRLAPEWLRGGFTVPEAWLERFTEITDDRGVAELTDLPAGLSPLLIRVSGPGVAPHHLPFDVSPGNQAVIKLGRPGSVAGTVRSASGETLADVPVILWVRGSEVVMDSTGRRWNAPDLRIDPGPEPLRTGPLGAFRTPPTLLGGSTYRMAIRQHGFERFVSDWVTLDGDGATLPPIVLRPLRTLTGRVNDRQGRAVAGARVFLAGGDPATLTDAEGRFALAGIPPGAAVILTERAGFRLQGRVVGPSARAEVGPLTLLRASEAPGAAMTPLDDPIPAGEARVLAERLLAPYLRLGAEKGNDSLALSAIRILGAIDVSAALEWLQAERFRDRDYYYFHVREELAARLAETDPDRAEVEALAVAEAGLLPEVRANFLVRVARALRASERSRRRALLERAALLFKKQRDPGSGFWLLTMIAQDWLDVGEPDRARSLLEEGKSLFDSLPIRSVVVGFSSAGPPSLSPRAASRFLTQLGRIDRAGALERLKTLLNAPMSDDDRTEVAIELAANHPAEAEQVFDLRKGNDSPMSRITPELRFCRRLAGVDPPRARRLAASLCSPGARACAWAFVALGQAEKDPAGASEPIDQAIREIDRLRESGPGPEPSPVIVDVLLMYPTNPAALILPVVERVAPDRLTDVFWRAVALHPRIDPDDERQLRHSYVGFECLLLARYEREVAAALFQPMDAYLRSLVGQKAPQGEFNVGVILARGCIDPRGTVELAEALAPPPQPALNRPVHGARLRLAEILGVPAEKRWKVLRDSMSMQLPLDD